MTCLAITGCEKVSSEDQSWIPPSEHPSTRKKMKLIGMMIAYILGWLCPTTTILSMEKFEDNPMVELQETV